MHAEKDQASNHNEIHLITAVTALSGNNKVLLHVVSISRYTSDSLDVVCMWSNFVGEHVSVNTVGDSAAVVSTLTVIK